MSRADDTAETCAGCGLALTAAHGQPTGYVAITNGRKLCGACSDDANGWDRHGRMNAAEIDADAEID